MTPNLWCRIHGTGLSPRQAGGPSHVQSIGLFDSDDDAPATKPMSGRHNQTLGDSMIEIADSRTQSFVREIRQVLNEIKKSFRSPIKKEFENVCDGK